MSEGRLRLAFLADPQIGCMASFSGEDEDGIDRLARRGMSVRSFPRTTSLDWDAARFAAAVAELDRIRPDLAVIGGDMIDDTSRDDQLDVFRRIAATSSIPLHLVPGNHDASDDAAVPTESSLEWYRSHFGTDHLVVSHRISDAATLTVLGVNSTVLSQPRHVEGGSDAELAWLDASLGDRAPGPTIVVSHHPPFVDHPDEAHGYWNLPLPSRLPFLEVVSRHEVDLVLCGHLHRNHRARHGAVEIVTTAAVGFPLGIDPPGFRVVEVGDTGFSDAYYPLPDPGWAAIGGPPGPMTS